MPRPSVTCISRRRLALTSHCDEPVMWTRKKVRLLVHWWAKRVPTATQAPGSQRDAVHTRAQQHGKPVPDMFHSSFVCPHRVIVNRFAGEARHGVTILDLNSWQRGLDCVCDATCRQHLPAAEGSGPPPGHSAAGHVLQEEGCTIMAQ